MAIAVLSQRVAAEVIGGLVAEDLGGVSSQRIIAEVISPAVAAPGFSSTLSRRFVVELIGGTKEVSGTQTLAERLVAEVIGRTGAVIRGLDFPVVPVTAFSAFFAVNRSDWASNPGGFWLQQAEDRYIGVYGGPSTYRIEVRTPSASVVAPFTLEPDVNSFVVAVLSSGTAVGTQAYVDVSPDAASALGITATGTSFGTLDLDGLNKLNLPGYEHSGQVGEVMLYPRVLSADERDYTRSYLRCKWLNEGCDPKTDLGPAP